MKIQLNQNSSCQPVCTRLQRLRVIPDTMHLKLVEHALLNVKVWDTKDTREPLKGHGLKINFYMPLRRQAPLLRLFAVIRFDNLTETLRCLFP